MVGAIIILLVTVSVGLLLYVYDLQWKRKHPDYKEGTEQSDGAESDGDVRSAQEESHGAICCGRHLICDKSLSPLPGEEIVYYDDEELDRYKGRQSDEYTDEEAEEFREIMMTMLPKDLPGWARSLQLRRLHLPGQIRDEFIMLVSEQ
ncbi:MAG: phospholipase [Muribaculum sp.]|nr:phospholipase [Muribaculum sp.]